MSTTLFFEHSNFKKTKQALIATSVTLFILVQLDFQTEFIEIFQLRLGVTKAKIIFFAQLAVVYFIYSFLIRASMQWSLEKQKNLLPILAENKKAVEEYINSIGQEYEEIIGDVTENALHQISTSSSKNMADIKKSKDLLNIVSELGNFDDVIQKLQDKIEQSFDIADKSYLIRVAAVDYIPAILLGLISLYISL
jgi:hypothetical protein